VFPPLVRVFVLSIPTRQPLAGYLQDEQWPGSSVRSIEELNDAIRAHSSLAGLTSYNTALERMGPKHDPKAVVDSNGAVHGVDGVHIVDAFIMPNIPSANTNLPTMMLAERIAGRWL